MYLQALRAARTTRCSLRRLRNWASCFEWLSSSRSPGIGTSAWVGKLVVSDFEYYLQVLASGPTIIWRLPCRHVALSDAIAEGHCLRTLRADYCNWCDGMSRAAGFWTLSKSAARMRHPGASPARTGLAKAMLETMWVRAHFVQHSVVHVDSSSS